MPHAMLDKRNSITELAEHDIHAYGTDELLKQEKIYSRYFEREFENWKHNPDTAADYGLDSSVGEISRKDTKHISTDHYNEEYKVYTAFLDKNYMAYTMGFFGATNETPLPENIALETAQENKYKLLIERVGIKDGMEVLDLGCGFGGFSKYLLHNFPNIKVTGVNPSRGQTDHISNVLMKSDPVFNGERYRLFKNFVEDISDDDLGVERFDRVVSIGLIEHITNINLLQQRISQLLKSGGQCIHHCIVSYDTIPGFLNSEDTLMGHYYPGAHIWPYRELTHHKQHLQFVDSWFVNGMNYWKTLDEWHKRFWESIDTLYPEIITLEQVEDWNKYFSLCKAMFNPNEGKSYGNGQYLFQKN